MLKIIDTQYIKGTGEKNNYITFVKAEKLHFKTVLLFYYIYHETITTQGIYDIIIHFRNTLN